MNDKLLFSFFLIFPFFEIMAQNTIVINDTISIETDSETDNYDYDSNKKLLSVDQECDFEFDFSSRNDYILVAPPQANNYGYANEFRAQIKIPGNYVIKLKEDTLFEINYLKTQYNFPIFNKNDEQIIKNSIPVNFLQTDTLFLNYTRRPDFQTPLECTSPYGYNIKVFRDANLILNTNVEKLSSKDIDLKINDKIVGEINPKSCGWLDGTYRCVDITKRYLTDTLVVADNILGQQNLTNTSSESVLLFPNPVKDKLSVNMDKSVKKITVINNHGNTIKSVEKLNHIYLKELSSGIYFVNILFDDNSFSNQKIIKE